jgi:gamma-glutamylcyclotransferase (GGCT)/AIG2-like uncharacterized protein YtfP
MLNAVHASMVDGENARVREGMNAHLFVYGTLLSRAQHPMGARLGRESRLLGEACIGGCRLYSLGRYPGLVEAGSAGGLVHGEVHLLNSPAVSLKWLDAYERISPDNANNDYERCERMISLAAGGELTAWVYLYRASVRGLPPVPDGRWAVSQN